MALLHAPLSSPYPVPPPARDQGFGECGLPRFSAAPPSDMNPLLAALLIWCTLCHVRATDYVPGLDMLLEDEAEVPGPGMLDLLRPLMEDDEEVQGRYMQPQRWSCEWRRILIGYRHGRPRYQMRRRCLWKPPTTRPRTHSYDKDFSRGFRDGYRDGVREGCLQAARGPERRFAAAPAQPVPGSSGYRRGYEKGFAAGQARACENV